MINRLHNKIFKNASKTYYYSSLFFPKEVRDDIFVLYAFVRTADDLVDTIPQKPALFNKFIKEYTNALGRLHSQDIVIDSFVEMSSRRKINQEWIQSFLSVMRSDLHNKEFITIKDTEEYIYGSADVIGLMIAKILNLPTKSYKYAQALGKSMQLSNFIRDIQEDNELKRSYFPQNELQKFGLKSLEYSEVLNKQDQFKDFIRFQISRYFSWQSKAEKGFSYIPKRYRVAIKTASDMYKLTQQIIYKDPLIIYKRKVKPSAPTVIYQGLKNSLSR